MSEIPFDKEINYSRHEIGELLINYSETLSNNITVMLNNRAESEKYTFRVTFWFGNKAAGVR